MNIKLVPLSITDAEMVFNWRNDPFISNLGLSKNQVSWNEHLIWFNETIVSSTRKAYIINLDDVPGGQIRFDKNNDSSCFISVYLLKNFIGKGYGLIAIKKGTEEIKKLWGEKLSVLAMVRNDNIASQKVFLKAGFNFIKSENNIHTYELR